MSLRYFVPSTPEEPIPALRPALLAHLVDVFRLPWGSSEAALVRDRAGVLHLLTDNVPACLPTPLRAAFTQLELTRKRPLRRIDAKSLYLFVLEQVTQPVETPGVDDPLELSGRMYGPFGDAGAPMVCNGALTVTRGDLLSGFSASADDALIATGPDGRPARCLHALVTGESADETRSGRGLVLVYPLAPAELDPTDASNEAIVAGILEDVLTALQADQRANGQDGAFVRRALPVACLADVKTDLERDGWEIRGDTAIRVHASLKKGIAGLLTDVLGVPDEMKRRLPREATVDEFLAIAREALADLPGWPGERARALRDATHSVTQAPPPRIPARSAPPAEPQPPRPVPRQTTPPRPPEPPDWHGDFGVPVRRTTVVQPKNVRPPPKRPSWMDDFE